MTLRGTPAVHLHPAKPSRVAKYTSSVFRANLNRRRHRSLSLRTTWIRILCIDPHSSPLFECYSCTSP